MSEEVKQKFKTEELCKLNRQLQLSIISPNDN